MLTGPVTKSGKTPIEIAVHKGKLEVIKYLVTEQGVDVNGESWRDYSVDSYMVSCISLVRLQTGEGEFLKWCLPLIFIVVIMW